jgi:hypothetical protein
MLRDQTLESLVLDVLNADMLVAATTPAPLFVLFHLSLE